MANNYSAFSEEIYDLTDEEIEWVHELSQLDWLEETDKPRIREMLGLDDSEFTEGMMDGFGGGFSFTLERNPRGGKSAHRDGPAQNLWLCAEEWFNLDHVIAFVQAFLAKFRPDDIFVMSWADWCEKPRLGEFGGGAAYITATDYGIKNAYSFREEWEQKHMEERGKL